MELLNDDMRIALNELDISYGERKLLGDILQIEKIYKEKEWTNDARKRLMEFIDENDGVTE